MPTTSSSPKPRTVGTGESVSTSSAARSGRRGGGERGAPDRGGAHDRDPDVLGALFAGLLHAREELDRVVDGEADQHGQHGDLGDRQGRPHGGESPEGECGGERGDPQRQQAGTAAEDEAEHDGHHEQHGHEQQLERACDRARQFGDDHGLTGEQVVLAVLQVPLGHRERAADEGDRVRPLRFARAGLQAHRDERGFAAREEVGEALLGGPGDLGGVVEHERGDEARVVEGRWRGEAVLRPHQRDLLDVVFERGLAGFSAELVRFGGGAAVGERRLADGPFGLAGLRLGAAALGGELFVDLLDGLVDERAGADHDLHGAQPPELPAGALVPTLVGQRGARDFAREAPLQPEQAFEVGAEQQLLQVALHHHVHGLFPEGAVVALRGAVGGAGAPDKRVGGGGGVQPQREGRAAQAEYRGEGDHQQRSTGRAAGESG